jgi:thymidylate synthase (FAD)
MADAIHVLDHGHVRLVDHMGSDLSIVRNARVSYDAEWRTGEDEGKDAKLIAYLVKNRHTSPFEAVSFTFDVKAPIFVFRQWHRHRTWSFNEVSARYAELPEEFYVPEAGS